MTTLAQTLGQSAVLQAQDVEWLQQLVGDWQVVADLSFSDLVLWVPGDESGSWIAAAHVRPNTGPMVFYEDVVGRFSSRARGTLLDDAFSRQRIVDGRRPWAGDEMAVREEAIPVVRQGRSLAVVTRHTNLTGGRTPSRLELTYGELATALTRMISEGEFPIPASPTGLRRGAPRVGDGVVCLDLDGQVTWASPNATSAIHRLGFRGGLIGSVLAHVVTGLVQNAGVAIDEGLALVVTGRAPWRTEISTGSASVSVRAIPLTVSGRRTSALLLLRDVSELRRREQELLTKDATIREIHHRVKNNLQTVAALLRLQARRLTEPGAKQALLEAVRRVGTIALVHETLSQGFDETVNFDEIALQGLQAVIEVATSDQHVSSSLTGTFGLLSPEDATSVAMIMSELVQNAVEHGLGERGGRINIHAERGVSADDVRSLTVTITDDGVGLPQGFRPSLAGLGTRIVTSLVQDLGGRIRWENRVPHGTRVEFVARLRPTS